MIISFLIPTKDGGEGFEKLIKSIKSNINYAYQKGLIFEYSVTLIINGDPRKPLSYIESNKGVQDFTEVKQVDLPGKIKSINSCLRNNISETIVILDDDIYFGEKLLYLALQNLYLNNNLKLVSFQTRALPYGGGNLWKRFFYDVINVRSLKNLYRDIDPFLLGRFIAIRREALKVPDYIINEDLYLSITHDGQYLIQQEEVFYKGEYAIFGHIRRVLRIEAGRNQAKAIFGLTYNKVLNKNKRQIDPIKLRNLNLYYKICYYCYVVLRFFVNSVIVKLFKHKTSYW